MQAAARDGYFSCKPVRGKRVGSSALLAFPGLVTDDAANCGAADCTKGAAVG